MVPSAAPCGRIPSNTGERRHENSHSPGRPAGRVWPVRNPPSTGPDNQTNDPCRRETMRVHERRGFCVGRNGPQARRQIKPRTRPGLTQTGASLSLISVGGRWPGQCPVSRSPALTFSASADANPGSALATTAIRCSNGLSVSVTVEHPCRQKKQKTEARPGRSGKVLEQTAVCVAQRPEGRPVRAGKILEASIPRRGRAVETHASPPLRKIALAAPF